MNLKKLIPTESKALTQQIRNTKRRLERLKEQRTSGPEAREADKFAPLAQGAMQCVAVLDEEIKKAEQFIARLEKKRARLKYRK
jgi:hypothetical protein